MTPLHAGHRWLAVCLGIFLGAVSMSATAIDPGTVKGKLTYDGTVYDLRHVYAWQPPAQTRELLVYVTDEKLPAAATRNPSDPAELVDLQNDGRLHGVRLLINPAQPDLKSLELNGFAQNRRFKFVSAGGSPKWKRLLVDGKRVVGTLQFAGVDMLGLAWSLDVEFSAPVFGPGGGGQASTATKAPGGAQTVAGSNTLTGEQARKSPQAEVFLAYEKALLWQGIDAAGAYMTAERLAGMKAQVKQFGEDGFKQMQAERRKSTPQGEARRKQIEKVVVDGDKAVLEARDGPNSVDEVRLAKTKDGWKIAK